MLTSGIKSFLEVLSEKGIKQTWLADQIGKSYNMVNSYVCNRRQPSIETLFKIADKLDVNPNILIKGSEVVNKNDFIPDVSNRRELLIAFITKLCPNDDKIDNEKYVDEFLSNL